MSRNVVNKNDLAKYVHDVAKMEKRIYVLNRTANSCRQKAATLVNSAVQNLNSAEKELIGDRQWLESNNNELMEEEKSGKDGFSIDDIKTCFAWFCTAAMIAMFVFTAYFSKSLFPSSLGMFYLAASIIFAGIATCLKCKIKLFSFLNKIYEGNVGFFCMFSFVFMLVIKISSAVEGADNLLAIDNFIMLIVGGVAFTVKYIGLLSSKTAAKADRIKRLNKYVAKAEEKLANQTKATKQKRFEHAKAKKQAQILIAQADLCDSKANELKTILNKGYVDVVGDPVPVDFRHIDCVMVLDFVFRNNLADSMKEAVLFYNNQVFQKAVIRGIDNICTRLDELTGVMQGLRTDLNDLQFDIHSLSMETNNMISNMASSIETSNAIQSNILSETRATKYATMAVKESVDNYHRYYR